MRESMKRDETSGSVRELLYDLPFEADLWEVLGRKISRNGEEFLREVKSLFDQGMIREIGPIFNPTMLGYKMTLLAASVPMDRVEEVAAIISEHPGVSHNYLRDHPVFNVWFTLAVAGDEDRLAETIENLTRRTNVPMRRFDNLAQYKISFRLSNEPSSEKTQTKGRTFQELDSATQKRLASAIEILQQGLPLISQPFEKLAGTMNVDNLLTSGNELRELGILRRFGVTWRHREIGFVENVLCIWQIPEEKIPKFVERITQIGQITHSYRRQTYPDWPWSIYTMIHARTQAEYHEIISKLTTEFPEATFLSLRTLKEFKKQRVIYRPIVSQ
jgi:DNA-binding Lrp family transcriptional regulator